MDLSHFLRVLKAEGQLLEVRDCVDPFLEIAALSAMAVRECGPALLFSNPRNSRHPILTNALASSSRLALALNQSNLEQFGLVARHFLQHPNNSPGADLPVIHDPPCQEVQRYNARARFDELPMLTSWPGDAGPCLTAAVVVTRHPETGRRNAGLYRMQIIDATKATLGWHPGSGAGRHFAAARRLGRPLEVSIALGPEPAVLLAASLPLPESIDEFCFASHFCDSPLKLAQCRTLDLLVPAGSQFILEGYADPDLSAREGPFGNHTGLQTTPRECPLFRLQALTHRIDPTLQAVVAGPPPSESTWMAKAHESMLRVQLRSLFPDIREIRLPMEGIFQNFLFVQLSTDCVNAFELLRALLDQAGLQRFRFLVAVDEAVDVGDSSQVLWRLGNCMDPDRDMRMVDGPLAPWHPSSTPGQGKKLLLDARVKKRQRIIPAHDDGAFPERIRLLWQAVQGKMAADLSTANLYKSEKK